MARHCGRRHHQSLRQIAPLEQRRLFGFRGAGEEGWWEGAAALAAGLAAQLVVARDGTVTCQHLHLTEDRFVPHTGLICKTNVDSKLGEEH